MILRVCDVTVMVVMCVLCALSAQCLVCVCVVCVQVAIKIVIAIQSLLLLTKLHGTSELRLECPKLVPHLCKGQIIPIGTAVVTKAHGSRGTKRGHALPKAEATTEGTGGCCGREGLLLLSSIEPQVAVNA